MDRKRAERQGRGNGSGLLFKVRFRVGKYPLPHRLNHEKVRKRLGIGGGGEGVRWPKSGNPRLKTYRRKGNFRSGNENKAKTAKLY